MNHKYDFGPEDQDKIVYVRAVATAELPAEVQAEIGDVKTVFAVHNADGERLALVRDRKLAFVLARQNDLSPVTVH